MPELFQHYWPYFLVGLDLILALMVTFHAVLHKRETDTIIAWVGVAWMAPFLGVTAYFCFGINRIRRRAVSLEIGQGVSLEPPLIEEGDYRLRAEFLERYPNLIGLAELGAKVTGKPLQPGNRVHFLRDGDGAFPAMIDAIDSAESSIALLSYIFDCGEVLSGDRWFPRIERSDGNVVARGVTDGPDEHLDQILEVILGALATASKHVRIVSPYFIPDLTILRSLIVAAHRGVTVDIVLPSDNNMPIVDWASTALIAQLIEKGCRVHRSAPPFDHTKLMVIDGVWSLIGSTNWDPRSLRLNFEFNVECYSMPLAKELEELIDGKIAGGEQLSLEQIENRSLPIKLRDGLARLASPYL